MAFRSYRGCIVRQHDEFGETGREWFNVSVGPDQRTLRAVCELDRDQVLRDAVMTLDSAWRPQDCYVRLTTRGAYMGAAWFRFTDTTVECEAFTAGEGRVRQTIPVAGRIGVFVNHALVGDGWQSVRFDHGKAERIQPVTGFHSSPNPLGDSGPMAAPLSNRLEFIGDEQVTVPAGTFATRYYTLLSVRRNEPLHIWVTGDDRQLVKMRWDLTRTTYVMTQLDGRLQ